MESQGPGDDFQKKFGSVGSLVQKLWPLDFGPNSRLNLEVTAFDDLDEINTKLELHQCHCHHKGEKFGRGLWAEDCTFF